MINKIKLTTVITMIKVIQITNAIKVIKVIKAIKVVKVIMAIKAIKVIKMISKCVKSEFTVSSPPPFSASPSNPFDAWKKVAMLENTFGKCPFKEGCPWKVLFRIKVLLGSISSCRVSRERKPQKSK